MATFENIRYCTYSEFKYFEEERKDPTEIKVNELYVAMFALKEAVDKTYEAVALPLQIKRVKDREIHYRAFNIDRKLCNEVLKLTISQNNYVVGIDTVIFPQEVPIGKGYVRDHQEGLDGTPPSVFTAEEIPADLDVIAAQEHLVLA